MAKISPVGSNMTVLHGKKYDVLFSYETPVAAKDIKTGEVFKTSKKWSATTSKHISKWLAGEKASEKPQEFFDDLDESKKDPAKQIAEALNIMLKGKSLNESRFTQTDFGTVEYMGKRYTLKNQADFTNRLLPGNFVNYHDAEEGEEFDFEMAADATSESGEDCTVYWIFSHTKGESDSDWDSFDYTDVDRIVCEPLEDEGDLDESKKDPAKQIAEALNVMLKDKTLNESNEEESEDGIWWSSSSGDIEIQLTKDQAESASVGGVDNESAIDDLLTNPEISSQFDDISDDALKSELKGYGAWDDEELSDREMNIKRVLWLAAGDISDGLVEGDMNESEEYEDLDEAKGDSLQNALDYLNKLIAAGKEFPDASSNAAIKFDVDIDDLTAAYDNQNLNESNLNESANDWSNKQVIDSRDIIERLQELEDDVENLDESDKEELELLRAVNEDGQNYSDWEHGESLINDSYWVDYVQEMLEDTGDIPKDLPHYIVIDWESTARNIQYDYVSIDVGGNDFWIRN